MELEALEGGQPQLPPRRGAIDHIRLGRKMNNGFAGDAIPAAIMKHNGIVPHSRQVILAELFPRYAAHLKDIHEIGFVSQFDVELKLMEVKILKRKIVEERFGRKQLFTANVYRVLGNLIRLPHGALAGGELNLRSEGLF